MSGTQVTSETATEASGRTPVTHRFERTTMTGQPLFLIVDDIVEVREDVISRGADVSEIWHVERGTGRVDGADPQRQSDAGASSADPDGDTRLLPEITERFPGRV